MFFVFLIFFPLFFLKLILIRQKYHQKISKKISCSFKACHVPCISSSKKMTGSPSQLQDLELIRNFRQGDKNCLGELFRRYLPQAFGVALKYLRDPMESEDAVMQVFEKLHKDLLHHEIHNFKSWLHSVVRNHCLMELRKKKGLFSVPLEQAETKTSFVERLSSGHPDEGDEKEKRLREMEEGILHLNSEQRTCIDLFYIKEMSYKDISHKTGYTLLQIKSHIQNGKRNLKIYLDKKS